MKQMKNKIIQAASFCVGLLSAAIVSAATISIADAPLSSSTTSSVLPNLMYVLDNSGSMGWDHMPDYVDDDNICKASAGTFTENCRLGDPAYMSNDFNKIYYNPDVRYAPAVNADGTSMPTMDYTNTAGWTAVKTDPYLSNNTTSLIPNASNNKGYYDSAWCNTNNPSLTDLNNSSKCNINNQYTYPSSTFYSRQTLYSYPYYYKINPFQYCANKNLTSCQTTEDATHTYPARLYWCNNSGLTTCQAKYSEVGNYNRAKWLGITTTSNGAIKILATNTNTPSASPTPLLVTDIKVAGVSIIAPPSSTLQITDNTVAAQRNTLATNIANAINAKTSVPNYTATSSGDEVTISGGTGSASIVVSTTTVASSGTTPTYGKGSFRISNANSGSSISNLRVGSIEILNQTIYTPNVSGGSNRRIALAQAIVNRINSYTSNPNYTATTDNASRPTITVTAVSGGTASNGSFSANSSGISYDSVANVSGGGSLPGTPYKIPTQITNFTGATPTVSTFERVNIEPGTASYPKSNARTDCLGTTCTFEDEMTNFANWYAYYRTRILMMKSSTSLAFQDIDDSFRVGFTTLSNQSSNYLAIDKFTNAQKSNWYAKLFSINPSGGTPLRSALANVGRMYAGQKNIGNDDPVQYSCQQNFTLLTTDGYWNTDSTSSVRNVPGNGDVGNMDNISSERPQGFYEGPSSNASTASLADTAKYYYETDLRNSAFGNCTNAGKDVCLDNVFTSGSDNNAKQHMTTFTLGLGVNGQLEYIPDYKTASSGDFFNIKNNTLNWPKPIADASTTVDDLWHAAVNGRGTYFSAQDPSELSGSLSSALTQIESKKGAGAAAATSTLNPVAGDNFAYVASYETVKWSGNLEARKISITTGQVGSKADWCLQDVGAGSCNGPNSSIVNELISGVSTAFCKTTSSTASACPSPGIFNSGTSECKVELATFCPGTMKDKVEDATDSRTIYVNDGGALLPFNYSSLVAIGENANFEIPFLSANLTQWSTLSLQQKDNVTPTNIVNYLRGRTGFEERSTNATVQQVFRFRESVIGDALDSTPAFNGKPKAKYLDPGYGDATTVGSFANLQANRGGTVYFGTNDGMLHAIDADNGNERWAFVPTKVIPNMWRLADKNYGANHRNFVNGDISINDICTANCTSNSATWKTILVGALNGGGTGYYALDITNPNTPLMMWEFDDTVDSDVGYSFGNPIITKRADGKWVVLVTSGYNNVNGSNPGKGFLYVLDAVTGQILLDPNTSLPLKYATGAGDSTTPSGLAKIRGYVSDATKNNTAEHIYGGDVLGNLWRFDINKPQTLGSGTAAPNPFKLAKIQGPGSVNQPITVKPEISLINGKRVIFIGTGKYLEASDLSDTSKQTLYAITDESYSVANNLATTLYPRDSSAMVQQTITNSGNTRSVSANPVDYTTKRGWYIDLPDSGERQNVASQLVFGTLIVPTIVPSSTECSPGGYGWINFLNFKTGGVVASGTIGNKTNAPVVGINVVYVNGQPKVSIVTADDPTPKFPAIQPDFIGGLTSGFKERRIIWRELINE
jgi:type IV pilus assembly protein PilY1